MQCVSKCCEKFMNVTGRVGMRFNEFYTEVCLGGINLLCCLDGYTCIQQETSSTVFCIAFV